MTLSTAQPAIHPVLSPVTPRRLLLLDMGGRFNRHWIFGMANCANRAGVQTVTLDLPAVAQAMKEAPASIRGQIDDLIVKQQIGAVISYCYNGIFDLSDLSERGALFRSFWELRGIPQFAIWADHPQWAFNQIALRPDLQTGYRSGNIHHFMKSAAHAWEVQRMLGWPNCRQLPMAVDPSQLPLASDAKSEFDLVAIYSEQAPQLCDWCRPFLDQDDPDPIEMMRIAGEQVMAKLTALWDTQAPLGLRPQLGQLSRRLIEYKIAHPLAATARHLPRLQDEFPAAFLHLASNPALWFTASPLLYHMRSWQRPFVLAYLARHLKVAVFGGGDWSHLGIHSQSGWVDFGDIPRVAARGRVVINVMPGHDEEGATPKTFELVSSARPVVHSRSLGLEELFAEGSEIEVFDTPRQARRLIEALLADPTRANQVGQAGRAAIETRHNWEVRLRTMFDVAGIAPESFGLC